MAGRGKKGLIGHTQPRRIAASSIAKRIAQELNTEPGEVVGYKVRFTDVTSLGATIKLMTEGGPEGSTMVLVYYIYYQGFKAFKTGYASAIAVILFLIMLVLTMLQWVARKKVSHYEE